jgi:C4-dicarboxylate-specific signal transduction histidine kinase
MIIANMNEVVHFILGFIDRRSRRRRLARERQAHWQELEENAAHEVEERSATVEYQPIEPSGHSPSSKTRAPLVEG